MTTQTDHRADEDTKKNEPILSRIICQKTNFGPKNKTKSESLFVDASEIDLMEKGEIQYKSSTVVKDMSFPCQDYYLDQTVTRFFYRTVQI